MKRKLNFNISYKLTVLFLFFVFLLLFILIRPSFAISLYLPITQDDLPEDAVLLNQSSLQELIYISKEENILVFRKTTSQLGQLKIGDVLYLGARMIKSENNLVQVENIINDKVYQKGLIIYIVPWQANHPPVISALIAQPSILELGQHSRLTCYAADQDNDNLFYYWQANKGLLRGEGASVTWKASYQPGDYFISCEVSDNRRGQDNRTVRIQVIEKLPSLTHQEKELILKFGWGNHRAIRWPDGYVAVYDTTNFSRMQEVLDEWNKVVGDNVAFYLSHNPQSPVKISYNYELSRKSLCNHIDTHWRNYQLYAAEIQINPDSWLCGYPINLYAAYLHCFSGVAGFNVWQGSTVDRDDWQNFTQIPDVIHQMIQALYTVPPGYEFN
jgi:hypothetical protein